MTVSKIDSGRPVKNGAIVVKETGDGEYSSVGDGGDLETARQVSNYSSPLSIVSQDIGTSASRWVKWSTNTVMATPNSDSVIEPGDLVWLDTNVIKPSSEVDHSSTIAAAQEFFHDRFLGVALESSEVGSTTLIKVATSGVFEFDMDSTSVVIGARIGIDDNAGGDEIVDQKVISVNISTPEVAFGRCVESTTGTTVKVAIRSTLIHDGSQAIS